MINPPLPFLFLSFFILPLLTIPVMAQQQVEITADTFTIEENTREAVFSGNVVVTHPAVKVWADRVVAEYGAGGATDIKSFIATGAVKLETKDQVATGERAVFTPGNQLLRLVGRVSVVNAGGAVEASELVVNLATNVSTFTSNGNGRVTGVFTTQ